MRPEGYGWLDGDEYRKLQKLKQHKLEFEVMNLKIGLITYNHPHLKTEQVIESLSQNEYRMFALPFTERERKVLFHHRPKEIPSTKSRDMYYKVCNSDSDIEEGCDYYLLLGAPILSREITQRLRIISCHPGIIPSVRGLDAFKWAIYENKPLGVTLYYLDETIDNGEIIAVCPTPIYKYDTLESLALRHYNLEIKVLSNFLYYLANPVNKYHNITGSEPHRRMPLSVESKMLEKADKYILEHAE